MGHPQRGNVWFASWEAGFTGDCGIVRLVEPLRSNPVPLDPFIECPSNTTISRPFQTAQPRQPQTGAVGIGLHETVIGS
jgi:hypothetical protein